VKQSPLSPSCLNLRRKNRKTGQGKKCSRGATSQASDRKKGRERKKRRSVARQTSRSLPRPGKEKEERQGTKKGSGKDKSDAHQKRDQIHFSGPQVTLKKGGKQEGGPSIPFGSSWGKRSRTSRGLGGRAGRCQENSEKKKERGKKRTRTRHVSSLGQDH